MSLRSLEVLLAACALALCGAGSAQAPAAFAVETVAQRTVESLPSGPLYWRIEMFPTVAEARAAAGPTGLVAEVEGQAWLFTLAPAGGASAGGRRILEIGPVPIVPAPRYLLALNRAGGPPGAQTGVHEHPGSEAFYVLRGQLTQRTPHGIVHVEAGGTLNGHGAGMPMQLTSSGLLDLDQLVLFVLDATRPFSEPASFD